MPLFSFSKVDKYHSKSRKAHEDIIDLKFPAELKAKELLIFIVEDDPRFMQTLNTHFSKINLEVDGLFYKFKVKNYATGKSCIADLNKNPDLIFLNYHISQYLPNALSGKEILNEIININPNQKVVILNELEEDLRHAFVENGLRDYIIEDRTGLKRLNDTIKDILKN